MYMHMYILMDFSYYYYYFSSANLREDETLEDGWSRRNELRAWGVIARYTKGKMSDIFPPLRRHENCYCSVYWSGALLATSSYWSVVEPEDTLCTVEYVKGTFLKELWHLKVRPVVIGGENRETSILCVCERTCLGCTALSWLLFLKRYLLQFYSFCELQWSTNSIFIYFDQYLLQFLKDCFLIDSIKQPKDIILLPFMRMDV